MTSEIYRDFIREWSLAGMLGEDGSLDRPYHLRRARVPAVIGVDGNLLIWRWDPVLEFNRPRPEGKGIGPLMKFASLVGAKPVKIFAFARKWGVLEICQHGLPYNHDCGRWTKEACLPLRHRDGVHFAEPIRAWYFFARQAASLLKVAALLRQGKTGPAEDMDILLTLRYGDRSPGDGYLFSEDVYHGTNLVSMSVERWLMLGNVRPHFIWDGERFSISLNSTLFGMLACQLMMAVGRTEGLGWYSGCGETYVPARRWPKYNQRNYCQSCRKRAAWRDAKAAQRRRDQARRST